MAHLPYNRVPSQGEVNTLPDMFVPDMSTSLRDLIRLYSIGSLPAEVVRTALYSDSDDFDDVLANDLAEYDLVDKERELSKLRQKFEQMRSARQRSVETTTQRTAPQPSSEPAESVGEDERASE